MYYSGLSPDEITLVDAAKNIGIVFEGMEGNLVELNVFGRKKKMELITMFEFSSERKCMSVIIRENNLIKLYVKGADNVIGKKLRSGN